MSGVISAFDRRELAECLAEQQAEREHELQRNARVLELARHNGYAIEIGDDPHALGIRFWRVPEQLVAIAGDQFLALKA